MNRILLAVAAFAISCAYAWGAAAEAAALLPTGQALTPTTTPGAQFTPLVTHVGPYPGFVADGASSVAVSPDNREMLVLTSGYNLYNGPDGKLVPKQSTQYIFRYSISGRSAVRLQTLQVPNSFGGIAWQLNGRGFIVGGGVDDAVYLFTRHGSTFVSSGKIALGHKAGLGWKVLPQAAGVAVSPDGRSALVANYYNDSVSLIDLALRTVTAEQDLRPGKIEPAQAGIPGGEFPFSVVWTDATHAWVSAPRDRQLVALSIAPARIKVIARVPTVGEPTALLVDNKNRRLLATEDNADRLAFIDLNNMRVEAEPRLTLPDALGAGPVGKGMNPNGVAILPDGRFLVTFGGINAVAVVAPGPGNPVQALIPTGWYPTAVATNAEGTRVFVVNRKSPPGSNQHGCEPHLAVYRGQPNACGAANEYIFQLEKAGLLQFPMPSGSSLARATLQVADNIGVRGASARASAEARIDAIRQHIKHVIFVIRENRTYDQVLGDLPVGNGDPRLAILGGPLSPNAHRLALQFVTFDNFYDSGEQSSTGWPWSTAARTTDLMEKTAPVNYARRGLGYESEEADRFVYEQQKLAERHATNPALSTDPDLLAGPALLTSPDPDDDHESGQGYIWDAAIRAGLSVRNYGFSDASVYDSGAPGEVPPIRDPYGDRHRVYTPGDRLLASRSDPYFRGFDLRLPDFWREREWEREYKEQEAVGTLPALTLLRLGVDHFGDFDHAIDGVNTVETQMADNDYALGRVVERVAAGKAADSTLIFVIEDDAQNGADHVDARRSVAFIVGPYVRQHALVSTHYTTINILRTIEAMLNLRPMNLNDALAMPMADVFDPAQSQWSYRADAADVLRTTQLPIPAQRFAARQSARRTCLVHSAVYWAEAMKGQDFSKEDRLDTPRFNSALWLGLGNGPEPTIRDARDLRDNRANAIKDLRPAPCAIPN